MENQNDKITEKESRIIDNSEVKDRVLRDESDKDGEQIINDRPIDAENAVPPDAWKNQQKSYQDAWENNKNQALEDDM
ncbi:hypothetical protein [Kaistella carnis]|uniref:Uncharacterized protein n=1 Tax=Kaistella carnis TaxID=1241979 RepID=A0A3G8XJY8_9FLAO|nr:hypothetical protein [Kaistella carnis]AZI32077.1 hypothetical protein EIB73_02295 [Kaistella carnis]